MQQQSAENFLHLSQRFERVRTGSDRFNKNINFSNHGLDHGFGSANFAELWTELCVRFRVVQVRTTVQDRTLTPLIDTHTVIYSILTKIIGDDIFFLSRLYCAITN